MILFPYNQKLIMSQAFLRQPLSCVNVTELLRRLQVKIENIYLFKIIIIKNMATSLKTGFAQFFSCCPKNLSCPNFGGGLHPPRSLPPSPTARTPMFRSSPSHTEAKEPTAISFYSAILCPSKQNYTDCTQPTENVAHIPLFTWQSD